MIFMDAMIWWFYWSLVLISGKAIGEQIAKPAVVAGCLFNKMWQWCKNFQKTLSQYLRQF